MKREGTADRGNMPRQEAAAGMGRGVQKKNFCRPGG